MLHNMSDPEFEQDGDLTRRIHFEGLPFAESLSGQDPYIASRSGLFLDA